jgi:membrane-bound lytic murein transglycosylase D
LNQQTKKFIELYVYKRARSASYILALAQYYFPKMQQIFDKHNVPEELIYLTIIESALNPTAVSRAGATGIWQFMYNTGKMYGLEVNTFIDDRRDPMKATEAAALHLRDLYNIFGDWTMAIAAYNCGMGNVRKAIQRSGNKTGFWNIYPHLPAETRGYFPAYCGALFMMKYYEAYGITPGRSILPLDIDTVMVDKELHFEQLAEVLEIDLQEIKSLNPQYKRDVIPAYVNQYPLTLRHQDIIRYLDLKDTIHAHNYEQYFTPLVVYEKLLRGSDFSNDTNYTKKYHTVKRGENLSKIAVRYGVSVNELQKMNRMTTTSVDVGRRLVVGYEHKNTVKNSNVSETKPATTSSSQTSSTHVTHYKIKSGDSLYSIAQKHGVSVEKIMKDNNITNPRALQIDRVLKIIK